MGGQQNEAGKAQTSVRTRESFEFCCHLATEKGYPIGIKVNWITVLGRDQTGSAGSADQRGGRAVAGQPAAAADGVLPRPAL